MIPREILVTESAKYVRLRIPTGFCPKAQGCEARATLGNRPQNIFNRNAVAAIFVSSNARGVRCNPVGVVCDLISFTQGSSCLATLGWGTQSLWDWANHPSKSTTTPLGLCEFISPVTQGSSLLATLGWRTQSLWDCPNRLKAELRTAFAARADSSFIIHRSSLPLA